MGAEQRQLPVARRCLHNRGQVPVQPFHRIVLGLQSRRPERFGDPWRMLVDPAIERDEGRAAKPARRLHESLRHHSTLVLLSASHLAIISRSSGSMPVLLPIGIAFVSTTMRSICGAKRWIWSGVSNAMPFGGTR